MDTREDREIIIQTESEEEVIKLFEELRKRGYTWNNGNKLFIYDSIEGFRGRLLFYIRIYKKVVSWSEIEDFRISRKINISKFLRILNIFGPIEEVDEEWVL